MLLMTEIETEAITPNKVIANAVAESLLFLLLSETFCLFI